MAHIMGLGNQSEGWKIIILASASLVFGLTQQQNDLVKSLSAPTTTATKNENCWIVEVGRLY